MLIAVLAILVIVFSIVAARMYVLHQQQLQHQAQLQNRIENCNQQFANMLKSVPHIKPYDKPKLQSIVANFFVFHPVDEHNIARLELVADILTMALSNKDYSDMEVRTAAFVKKMPHHLSKGFYGEKLEGLVTELTREADPVEDAERKKANELDENPEKQQMLEKANAIIKRSQQRKAQQAELAQQKLEQTQQSRTTDTLTSSQAQVTGTNTSNTAVDSASPVNDIKDIAIEPCQPEQNEVVSETLEVNEEEKVATSNQCEDESLVTEDTLDTDNTHLDWDSFLEAERKQRKS